MKSIKPKIGDVFQIKLPNEKYAYGRLYKENVVGIYNLLSDDPKNPPLGSRDFMFFVGMYTDVLTKGVFEIIAEDPFKIDEEEWAPPMSVRDQISGEYSLYHKGQMNESTKEECENLEPVAAWDSDHIINRIMRENLDRYY